MRFGAIVPADLPVRIRMITHQSQPTYIDQCFPHSRSEHAACVQVSADCVVMTDKLDAEVGSEIVFTDVLLAGRSGAYSPSVECLPHQKMHVR